MILRVIRTNKGYYKADWLLGENYTEIFLLRDQLVEISEYICSVTQ